MNKHIFFGKLLDVLLYTETAAIAVYALLVGVYGAGRVPVYLDVAYLVALLITSFLCVVMGPFIRAANSEKRRWRTSVLAVLMACAGSVLLIIGVGKMT